MSFPPSDVVLAPEFATRVWNQLSDCVDAFIGAWDAATEPPSLAPFVPEHELPVRRLILNELIKVDLEYRWRNHRAPRLIEAYLAEFPELVEAGMAPCDLLYEEYHVRRQAGDAVEPQTYFERFPLQAKELQRLLGLEAPHLTTTLISGPSKVPINLGERIDDFDLLTELGRGAFACVYLARQRSMQRLVALKVSADRGAEPQTLAQLDHPNIVRVFDQRSLPERKLRLLYMQYVPGGTLQSVHDYMHRQAEGERNGRQFLRAIDHALDERGESAPESSTRQKLAQARWPEVICWLGARIGTALHHAHGCGVLHRDLKPANVLVAADGNPKLADFNISFSSKLDGATPAAYFGGSLAYMSPEQLEACNPAHEREPDELDGRSDVYSLGVMLWELLTGKRPFPDEPSTANWSTLLERMVEKRRAGVDAVHLARLPKDCPPGLKEALLLCLMPTTDRRPAADKAARQFELCLQPHAQQLLHAPQNLWSTLIRRYPVTVTMLAVVGIHVAMSILNIKYNFEEILRDLNLTAQQVFLDVQLGVVNGVAYAAGIAAILKMAWPVFSALQADAKLPSHGLAAVRKRCLRMGDYLARIAITLWLVTGIVFPAWLHAPPQLFAHFLCSQILCGLIATTISYFVLTFFGVHYFYPRLLTRELAEPSEATELVRLSTRMWLIICCRWWRAA